MSLRYKNRTVINQRGGSIDIDNSTDNEKVHISQRSGSNINLTNVVTSELASNNKQVNVVHDLFQTVGNNASEFIVNDKTERVGQTTYTFKGFIDESELDAYKLWKDTYADIAATNSQFKISRGGIGYPNGDETPLTGDRSDNPVLNYKITTVDNKFSGYLSTPIRDYNTDQVVDYTPVPSRDTNPATEKSLTVEAIEKAAGASGSNAPGVLEFGASKSAATENGNWEPNPNTESLADDIVDIQDTLMPIEQAMGNGGDDISYIKRNKLQTVGAVFNDYPSIRVDEKGRSHPFEVVVSDLGAFKNHDYFPVVEDVDNSSNFPGGDDTNIIGNKQSVSIGSGGYNLKTTGPIELGGSSFKGGFKKCNISATYGIHLLSENVVELASLKAITLRTNRQVFVESAMGVKNNLVLGGGMYAEGELYVQHITAPVEIQQTEDTIVLGKFNAAQSRTVPIGEVLIDGAWETVYALNADNLIITYPHSHHFKNIPIRLCESNSDVRKFAQDEDINSHGTISPSLAQRHERKPIFKVS
jgi:hypothetical protein